MKSISVILVLAILAGGASAQTVASSADPRSLRDRIAALGHDARLEPYASGRPRIKSSIVGVNYSLAFYGCLDDMTGCEGLMFTAGFDMTDPVGTDLANEWNETRVYSRAFIDEEGDPYVQMPVPNAGALSQDDVQRLLEIWENAVVKFTDTIGFTRPEADTPAATTPEASAQPAPPAAPPAVPPVASGRVGPRKAPSANSLGAQDR